VREVRYPQVTVKLIGEDGNGAGIIGKVAGVIRREVSPEAASEYVNEAMNCDYNAMLRLTMRTVNVE